MKRFFSFCLIVSVLACFMADADSLFRAATAQKSGTLIAKESSHQVGDIVTVLVKETIDSSVNSDLNTKKESTVQSEAPSASNSFLTAEGKGGMNIISQKQLPNWDINAKNETKTRGQSKRTTELNTSVTCLITQVLPNGLLKIEGEKTVSINREDSRLHVAGLVRTRDVSTTNTVDSTQIANATIELKGKGPLWNNQRRGFVTRILDWFSPF